MARFTPEQFQQVMAVIISQVQSAQAAHQAPRRVLDNRVGKFAGGEEKWMEWSFEFKIAAKAQSSRVERAMRMVERAGEIKIGEFRAAD
eukprot:8522678-Lingulodinium_polyedra.AAC.1